MDINHNKVVYIDRGEHNDPHGLPQQQYLEDSTEIEHTLYSHTAISSPKIDSFKKLEYIYQHFQDSKKIYESDPDTAMPVTDNTLYPHIDNNIKYGLFEDVINSYYLDSQINDDFNCNKECYTNTQHMQQKQQLTPCTLAYDHIAQHINNLADSSQQNTLYAMEENASLFTSDTTTPYNFNITEDTPNLEINSECKLDSKTLSGIHSQSKHKHRNTFGNSNIQYHNFGNGDALNFKDKYTTLLQQDGVYWCLQDPIMMKSYQISTEMDIETMPHAMYFSGNTDSHQN